MTLLVLSEILGRFWDDLVSRPSGPMSLRFLLQPTVAAILGIRDGLADARERKPPYLHTMLTDPDERGALLREGLQATTKVVGLAMVLDVIYQIRVFGEFHPLESVVIALALGFVPYVLIRGPASRATRRLRGRRHGA
jgi:hypothetical protein